MDLCETLGLTKEELQERVVDRISERLLTEVRSNETDEFTFDSSLMRILRSNIKAFIDAKITAIADEHIKPKVSELIENVSLQETNKWGEQKGKILTFREYLTEKAECYLTEKVDYNGESKLEKRGYSWTGVQTRIAHMIHRHLHYEIEKAMKDAVKNANELIVAGIQETAKMKLAEIANALNVKVTTK